eukprot:GHVH01016770.1.p1 GENE.GHVH01016770.1~~GHVH01016770.1.p1  ORF type:complete len:978 (-),score=158.74 GHVH01016770.1:122-3055(-)
MHLNNRMNPNGETPYDRNAKFVRSASVVRRQSQGPPRVYQETPTKGRVLPVPASHQQESLYSSAQRSTSAVRAGEPQGYLPRRRAATPVRDPGPASSFFTRLVERSASRGPEPRGRSLVHKQSASCDLINSVKRDAALYRGSVTGLPYPPTEADMRDVRGAADLSDEEMRRQWVLEDVLLSSTFPASNDTSMVTAMEYEPSNYSTSSRNPFLIDRREKGPARRAASPKSSFNEAQRGYHSATSPAANAAAAESIIVPAADPPADPMSKSGLVVRMVDQEGFSLDKHVFHSSLPPATLPSLNLSKVKLAVSDEDEENLQYYKRGDSTAVPRGTSSHVQKDVSHQQPKTATQTKGEPSAASSVACHYATVDQNRYQTDRADEGRQYRVDDPKLSQQVETAEGHVITTTDEIVNDVVQLLERLCSARCVSRIVSSTDRHLTSLVKVSFDHWRKFSQVKLIEFCFERPIHEALAEVKKVREGLTAAEKDVLKEWRLSKSDLISRFQSMHQAASPPASEESEQVTYPWIPWGKASDPKREGPTLSLEEQKEVLQKFDEQASVKVREIRADSRQELAGKMMELNKLSAHMKICMGVVALKSQVVKSQDRLRLFGFLGWRQALIERSAIHGLMRNAMSEHCNPRMAKHLLSLVDVVSSRCSDHESQRSGERASMRCGLVRMECLFANLRQRSLWSALLKLSRLPSFHPVESQRRDLDVHDGMARQGPQDHIVSYRRDKLAELVSTHSRRQIQTGGTGRSATDNIPKPWETNPWETRNEDGVSLDSNGPDENVNHDHSTAESRECCHREVVNVALEDVLRKDSARSKADSASVWATARWKTKRKDSDSLSPERMTERQPSVDFYKSGRQSTGKSTDNHTLDRQSTAVSDVSSASVQLRYLHPYGGSRIDVSRPPYALAEAPLPIPTDGPPPLVPPPTCLVDTSRGRPRGVIEGGARSPLVRRPSIRRLLSRAFERTDSTVGRSDQ